ncbi:MAG: rhomboid family intramembrane serine protease [Planctomycetota bacterium]|nr:rhomboid family intramembrane serine protease [Planctomycetota bacterium]
MDLPGREVPILITEELLDRRVDFEKGMSVFPRLTIVLIVSYVVVLFLEFIGGALADAPSLVRMGALDSTAVDDGEVWRLLSAIFMHAGVLHLVGNALALYILGMVCEHAYGAAQLLVLYCISGLAGSCLSVVGMADGVPSVGASGAIFGLMGGAASVILRNARELYVRDKRIGWVILLWGLLILAGGFLTPFIDNYAHLGGLFGGTLAALFLRPKVVDRSRPLGPGVWIVFALVCGALGATAFFWLPRLV